MNPDPSLPIDEAADERRIAPEGDVDPLTGIAVARDAGRLEADTTREAGRGGAGAIIADDTEIPEAIAQAIEAAFGSDVESASSRRGCHEQGAGEEDAAAPVVSASSRTGSQQIAQPADPALGGDTHSAGGEGAAGTNCGGGAAATVPDDIPARMLNEFVYCPRLFYYEFVEGIFVESADTLRGAALHTRVDAGKGNLPPAKSAAKKKKPGKSSTLDGAGDLPLFQPREGSASGLPPIHQSPTHEQGDGQAGSADLPFRPDEAHGLAGSPPHEPDRPAGAEVQRRQAEATPAHDPHGSAGSRPHAADGLAGSPPHEAAASPGGPETIHSRSVQMGSVRLGVVAKMDLVETRVRADDPGSDAEVCPVDYKAGAPRNGAEGNELWDTDRMQLGLQALILRDNGYTCLEGVIYYRATRQRVRLPITAELEAWVVEQIAAARACAAGPIPAPLDQSPKCRRCSLAPVCLPDETRLLAARLPAGQAGSTNPPSLPDETRLLAGRELDETGSIPPTESQPTAAPRRLMAARSDQRALYLTTQGLRVGSRDEVLEVRDKETVLDLVRMRDVDHVALFGNIQITTQAVQKLCEAEIPVSYFSMGGWFYGTTHGHGLKNVFLRLQQFRAAADPASCLRIARRLVAGKIRNHRTLLMRNHLEAPAPALAKLKHACARALQAASLEELLGVEGAAAALYFEHFGGMIKCEAADELPGFSPPTEESSAFFRFNFSGRNRRPPTDPVNACLSLAYSLLAKDCLLAAMAVGFDPYVGFYHQPRFGRPALALDLMEEFRPLVADSVVLTAINNQVLTLNDFVRAGEAVNLSAAGRKRFFQVYEQRLGSLLTHPVFDYKVSYRRALELQARLLARTLTGEIADYLPLTTR